MAKVTIDNPEECGVFIDPDDGEVLLRLSKPTQEGDCFNMLSLAYREGVTDRHPRLVSRDEKLVKLVITEEELFAAIVNIARSMGYEE